MTNTLVTREISEAIDAGEEALRCLTNAERCLNSARGWGVIDLFGGGTITGFIKHAKINDAKRCIDQARFAMNRFEKEVRDVSSYINLSADIGNFLTFADFFFDGFLADMLVQSKINDARKNVRMAIERVEDTLRELRSY